MLHTSQFSQLKVVCPDENLLENFCMVNPPERRGISATGGWLYPLSGAGSGADTELTGRHPAPCNERYIALLFSPSPEGLFNEGKTLGSEMLNHSQFR
ncbi:hypothetical protein AW120_25070 [Escherichia coli]|nr:hypothetical protein AW120_25070 [Escherichia coli]